MHTAEIPFKTQPLKPARPILKWAGGKSQLLPFLRQLLPSDFNRYVEPFLGGGALFFDTAHPNCVISDSNPELIHFYKIVRNEPEALWNAIRKMRVTKEAYYELRATRPQSLSDVPRAARFLYLNKTCYNGLYRVNRKGEFNTPYSHQPKVRIADRQALFAASRALASSKLFARDYQDTLAVLNKGDFVYLDPPYWPLGGHANFKRYTKDFFTPEDHAVLAEWFRKITKRGVKALLSNSSHPEVLALYRAFNIVEVDARRAINCDPKGRGKVKELLVTNYSLKETRGVS